MWTLHSLSFTVAMALRLHQSLVLPDRTWVCKASSQVRQQNEQGRAGKKKNTLQVLQNSPDQLPRMGGSDANVVFLLPRPGELGGWGRVIHLSGSCLTGWMRWLWAGLARSVQPGPPTHAYDPRDSVRGEETGSLRCQQWIRENRFHLSYCSGQKSRVTLPPLLDFPRQQIDPESGLSSHRPRSPWPTPGHCGRDDPQLAVQLAPCSLPAEPGTAAGAMLPPPSHIGALLCSHFQSQTQGPQTGEGSPTGSSRAHCQLQACLAAWAPCSPCPRASAQVSLHRGVHTLASCFLQVSGAPGAFSASQPCSCPHSPSPTLCGFLCCTCF